MPIHTTHTRDAALRELGRLNRWLVAGSVVLTGAFAEAAANAFPGKTSKPASARRATGSAARTRTPTNTTTHPLQPPAQAPQASAEAQSSTQTAPAQESHESAPAQEPAPEPEASAPVVSGGS
jgi:hypothetical protein